MASIVLNKTVSLNAPITVESLHGVVFSNESNGHKFVISCMQDGELVNLTGSVSARFMRSNGTTILLESGEYGSIVDGKAVVTLHQDCYNVLGRFQMAVFLTEGNASTCIYACVGSVQRSEEGTLIDSGEAVPSLDELLAKIEACEQATADAKTAANAVQDLIAETFATNKAYSAGSYVYYNGSLYRFTSDHAAGAWTGTDATEVKLADDTTDLKNAIADLGYFDGSTVAWKNGTIDSATGATASSTTRIISDGFIFAKAGSKLGLNNYTNYKIGVALYWAPSTNCFLSHYGFNAFKDTYTFENDCYIIPTCAYMDNRTITDDNRPTLVSVVEWGVFGDSVKSKTEDNAESVERVKEEVNGAGTQPVWQIGGIISATGNINPAQTNRMVMTTPVRALKGSKITLTDTEHYNMGIAEYSYDGSTYQFTGYHAFAEAITEYTVPADCWCRVVLKWVNDDKSFNAAYLDEYAKAVSLDLISDGSLIGRVAALEKTTTQKHSLTTIKSTDWLIRGINSADGSILIGADNRITTKWFLHVKAGSTIALDNYTAYQFSVAIYDDETIASFTEYKGFAVNTSTVTIADDCYIIISMRYAGNQVITNISDLTQHLILNLISADDADSLVNDSAAVKELLKNGLSLTHRYYRGKKQYRIHVDEVIWALWDLAQHNYTSIFEQSEFADYKRIHDMYGTCFVLSLHYKQQQGIAWHAPFPAEMIGWTLEEMPDTWIDEFIANSDWLKFSFHAYAYEFRYEPGSTDRDWEQDIIDMREQVVRFAGEETWLDEFVKTHGVVGDQKLIRIFMNQGAKWFEGDSEHVEVSDPVMQSYYLTDEQQNKMFADGTYYDPTNKALFFAGAGNLERLYGFVSGTIDMSYYLDNYVWNPSYKYKKKCDYMTFCSHESPMLGGMVIVVNGVKFGDSITIDGRTYTAGTDFDVGSADGYTAQNLYAVLDSSVIKHMQSANLLTIYGTLGSKSDSFEIRTPMQQIEVVAKWCHDNGWEPHHLDESSFYKF